jgi:hypothetical protein
MGYLGPPINFELVNKETAKDQLLSKLFVFIKLGKQIDVQKDQDLKPFAIKQQQISIENGILLWGFKITKPVILRKRILNVFHTVHAGVVKTKSVARSYI